ncbi:MAG: AAA family ATPase [Myxococcota bacterium]
MSAKPTLRAYLVAHTDGHLTGYLLRRGHVLFEQTPPEAYGPDEASVLGELEARLQKRVVRGDEKLERYLWTEHFHTRTVAVTVHPASLVEGLPVVGARELRLRLTYAWSRVRDRGAPVRGGDDAEAAYRVVLPRFGWSLFLEDLESSPRVLASALSGALTGQDPRLLFDFRQEGEERVVEHDPNLVRKERGSATRRAPAAGSVLAAVADDLVESAAQKRLPRAVALDRALPLTLASFVTGASLPSVLLVGGTGTGKTMEVNGLARELLRARRSGAEVPLAGLYRTSTERLLAGMVYVGMWQERALALVDELRQTKRVLAIDRLVPFVQPRAGGASLADLFAPAVAAGDVALIAEATPEEVVAAQRLDARFVELFRRRRVFEPNTAALLPALEVYAERVFKGTEKRLLAKGARRLLQLLGTYRRDQSVPGKAFRFLDAEAKRRGGTRTLDAAGVEDAFARWSGLPLELVSDRKVAGRAVVASRLRERVIGQGGACEAAAASLVPFKAGLNPPDRPLGTLLFVGPTGVGKTELAKQLTRYLFGDASRMVRLDMSEYGVPGSGRRLLASGRGVRSLASQVRQQPLTLVLLDEIEKAHVSVYDLLLGVLGEGRLTDDAGRLVDFRMTFLVMTSNLGVRETAPAGFDAARGDADYRRAVREHFRPELLGRIDQIVPFRSLGAGDVERIVDVLLAEVRAREGFARRNLVLEVSDAARARLAERGHDPRYGARPLKRVIETAVVTPLAVRLAREPGLRDRTLRIAGPDEAGDVIVG